MARASASRHLLRVIRPERADGSHVGACIYESEAFDYLDAPVERVTGADIPMPYASNLEIDALPQINNIITGVQKVCYRL